MATTRAQITSTLVEFYQQPVAQVSVELFLSIMAVLFFAMFAIRPTLVTMSDLVKEIEDKRKLDTQLSQKIASLSTAQGEFFSLQNDLPVLDDALPDTPEFAYSIKLIEKTASEMGLVITGLSVQEIPAEISNAQSGETTSEKNLERVTVPVTVSVTGEYLKIRDWLRLLKQQRRSVLIESIAFSTNDDSGTQQLKATADLGLPYLAPKSKAAATPAPAASEEPDL